MMNRTFLSAILISGIFVTGCKTPTSTTSANAIAPGATSLFDSATYESLASIHALVASLTQQISAGTLAPTSTEKAALNQIITDLNTADIAYAAFHAGVTTQAAMQSLLTTVQADQVALATAVTNGAK